MAQIVTNKAIADRCNLLAIRGTGSKISTVLKEGEVWLVDTTNTSKVDGFGKYDSFIIGDGVTPASMLEVQEIDGNKQNVLIFDASPTAGSSNPVTSEGIKSALDLKIDTENVYDKQEINEMITPASPLPIVVTSDHTDISDPSTNTIYRETNDDGDGYKDWMYVNNTWEKIADIEYTNGNTFSNISDLSGKTTEQKEAMIPDGNAVDSIMENAKTYVRIPVDLNALFTVGLNPDSSSGQWKTTYSSIFLSVKEGDVYEISPVNTTAIFVPLKTCAFNENADYTSNIPEGYSRVVTNNKVLFTVPEGCNTICFQLANSGGSTTPSIIKRADISVPDDYPVSGSINAISSDGVAKYCKSFAPLTVYGEFKPMFLSNLMKWYTSDSKRACVILYVKEGDQIHIKANQDAATSFAFLSVLNMSNGSQPTMITGKFRVAAGEEQDFVVPEGSVYMWVNKLDVSGNNVFPEEIYKYMDPMYGIIKQFVEPSQGTALASMQLGLKNYTSTSINSSGEIVSNENTYSTYISTVKVGKGSIIDFYREALGARVVAFGFTESNLSEEDDIVGQSVDLVYRVSNTIHSIEAVAPYDGYVVISFLTTTWTANSGNYKIWNTLALRRKLPQHVICPTAEYVGNSVIIDTLHITYYGEADGRTIYANGNSSSHQPKTFALNSDANFLLLDGETILTDSTKKGRTVLLQYYAPDDIMIGGELFPDYINKTKGATGGNTHDIPENIGVYNALRKAKQLLLLPWTAKNPIPYNNGTYAKNSSHTGMIYSSVKEYFSYIMLGVSMETFMTAINNSRSVIYTENVSSSGSQSSIGRTYHGANCAAYYGMVCSSLLQYAYGLKGDYRNFDFRAWKEMDVVEDQSAYGAKLGDCLWTSGHVRMVTDIVRNSKGVITRIEITEMWQDGAKLRSYTADSFNAELGTGTNKYTILRWKNIYKNRSYTPLTQFVAVDDEVYIGYDYNDDICPNYGNKANYIEGDSVVLNLRTDYETAGFTNIELYKDNSLYDTIEITDEDMTLSDLTYGKYKARLVNDDETEYSDYCEWIVVNMSVVKSGDSFTFSSSNATPVMYRFVNSFGSAASGGAAAETGLSLRYFTTSEKSSGSATPYGEVIATSSLPYLRVLFETDFGIVKKDIEWLSGGESDNPGDEAD